MRNNNLRTQLCFRCLWALVAVIATVTTFTDHLACLGGDDRPVMLFYTTWSVWFAALAAVGCCIGTALRLKKGEKTGHNRVMPIVKFTANIMMIATFIVAGFVLPEKLWTADYWTFGGAFKHFLLPILTIMDCVLFDARNHIRASYPLLGVVSSLAFWAGMIIRALSYRASCGGAIPEALWNQYYPYGFTNFDNGKTVGGLCGLLGGILVGLILIGFVFWWVDKLHKENGKTVFEKGVHENDMSDLLHGFHK